MIDESVEPPEPEEAAAPTPEAEASTPVPADKPAAAPADPRRAARGGHRRRRARRSAREARDPGCRPRGRHRARGRRPARSRGRGGRSSAAAAAAEEDRADEQPVAAVIDLAAGARYRATGKRKTAVARVILRPGTGAYTVNGKTLDDYFPRPALGRNIRQPLEAVGYEDRMDVVVRVHGGGVSAQAGALRHGISRALLEADPNLRGELKRRGFLTRDPRVKERKKAGLKKARKRPQFSKR